MKYEDILEEVGSFGAYQKLLCFTLLPLTTGLVAMTYYTQIFILTAPNHFCKQVANDFSNSSLTTTQSLSFSEDFFQQKNISTSNLVCHQYNKEELESFIKNGSTSFDFEPQEDCTNGWNYNYNNLFSTVTSQNNWVCGEAWKPYLIVTCFWVGNTVGAWIFGGLSDVVGRRPIVAASLLVYGAAGVGSVFVADYFWAFLALRIMTGFSHHTVTHLPFILVVEYCGIKSRVVPLFMVMASYTLGSFIAPSLGLLVWNWKILALSCSVPSLCLLLFYKWLPESPSWMMTKGHLPRMVAQLEVVSKFNSTYKTKDDILQQITAMNMDSSKDVEEKQEVTNTPLTHVLKFPKLRKNVFAVLYVWMIGCMCFYGHCQNTANLGSDIFMSYLYGATIEIPSWGVPYLIEKFGRKVSLVSCFLLSGLAGTVYATLPLYLENVIFSFALLGRLFITGAYYITLQYGPEIFPTVIRGRGVAMSETLGGIAIFVSPLVVYTGETMRTLPIIIFSILALSGGLITLVLPETKGKSLPQTLSQAELFAQESAPSYSCLNGEKKSASYTIDEK